MTLKGKRVLILGGTSGIGLAVAKAAKAEGSDVVVVSSKQSRVDSALALLGEGTEGYVTNLSDETAVETLFGKMGPLDHLVYTAGDSVWQCLLRETFQQTGSSRRVNCIYLKHSTAPTLGRFRHWREHLLGRRGFCRGHGCRTGTCPRKCCGPRYCTDTNMGPTTRGTA
jgi:NAD(P)-dependent dehydrogenase (short-subunit alcohol dehydrogenase family)